MQLHKHENTPNDSPVLIPSTENIDSINNVVQALVPDAIKKINNSSFIYRRAKVEGKINQPTSILASLLSLAAARTKNLTIGKKTIH